MAQLKKSGLDLSDIEKHLPRNFTPQERAVCKTIFLKRVSLDMHKFYGGKMQTLPKVALPHRSWFNAWYTPGVSAVSTAIRDNNDESFSLSNRGNLVAIVSDSTRVLGVGDCSPAGGLGVMEGKAFLMKYLGGLDAVALCIDSRDANGQNSAAKIIDFVKMVQPSFGAINLEDISQPNCYAVLDELRENLSIPVWHDDAQGTACIILAGLINSLKLANKKISEVKIIFMGAGASATACAKLMIKAGADPQKMAMFGRRGGLHAGREDIKSKPQFYRQWEMCELTNPERKEQIDEAVKGADVLVALTAPAAPIKPEWIKSMAKKPVVFACSNPVPEIYPEQAKAAGAFIVGTGRGDYPNQLNNSVAFPGILKGALIVRAKKITDGMAISAARAIADSAAKKGLSPDKIVPLMEEREIAAHVAMAAGAQAIAENIARVKISPAEIFVRAEKDIKEAQKTFNLLMKSGAIKKPPQKIISDALKYAITQCKR
ncbi:MAG: NADP-dependent malic enzyme [Elusimicrobia bacterium]|nr:NADP-dependent malic enzyme [Elusimicrobiota bacterium]